MEWPRPILRVPVPARPRPAPFRTIGAAASFEVIFDTVADGASAGLDVNVRLVPTAQHQYPVRVDAQRALAYFSEASVA